MFTQFCPFLHPSPPSSVPASPHLAPTSNTGNAATSSTTTAAISSSFLSLTLPPTLQKRCALVVEGTDLDGHLKFSKDYLIVLDEIRAECLRQLLDPFRRFASGRPCLSGMSG